MKLSRKAGKTSQTVNIFIADSSSSTGGGLTGLAYNTASLVAYYARPAAAAAAITLATQTTTGAWSSGGFVEISSANMPGWYRFDIPDACLAAGADSVGIHFKGAANMAPLPIEIDLGTQVDVVSINAVSTSPVTTIKAVQGLAVDGVVTTVTNQLTGAAIATAIFQDTTAGNYTAANSIGKSIMNGVALGTGLTVARCTLTDTVTTLTNLPAITANWLTATGIAADAITAAKIADGAIDTPTFAAGTTIPRCTLTDTLTTYTGNTVQTGDSFGRIGVAGVGLTNLGDVRIANLDATVSSRGTSTLTQTQVSGGAYALNNSAFAFNAAMDFTTAQKAATLARVSLVDLVTTTTTVTNQLTAATIAAAVEAAILNEGDATALLAAIAAKVEDFILNDGDSRATLAAIGSAVRTNLAVELARIDVATSTRLATSGYTTPLDAAGTRTAVGLGSANLDTQLNSIYTVAGLVQAKTDNLPALPAAVGSAMTLAAASIATASFAAGATIPRCTLVDTTTTNTDMRGTNSAALATTAAAIQAKTDNLPSVPFVHTAGKVWALDGDGNAVSPASATTAGATRTALGMASADLDTQLDSIVAAIPVDIGAAVVDYDVGDGRTVGYFLQGGMNKVVQAANGLSFTVYQTDDTTELFTGTTSRLATSVGAVRNLIPG